MPVGPIWMKEAIEAGVVPPNTSHVGFQFSSPAMKKWMEKEMSTISDLKEDFFDQKAEIQKIREANLEKLRSWGIMV